MTFQTRHAPETERALAEGARKVAPSALHRLELGGGGRGRPPPSIPFGVGRDAVVYNPVKPSSSTRPVGQPTS